MGIVYLAAVFVIGGLALAFWALKPEPKVVAIGMDPEDVIPTSRESSSRARSSPASSTR